MSIDILQSSSQSDSSIIICELVKTYGSVFAINGISLKVRNTECLGIIGPNGAGKTTLFQCLLGLVKIQKGSIRIFGKKVVSNGKILSSLRNLRLKIGYVPEYQKIYPFLTIEEYLNFLGKLFGLTSEQIAFRIEYLLKNFGLEPFKRRLVQNLSRGNHQKLVLCASLIHQPTLLLLDEPLTSLDVSTRKKVKILLNKYVTTGIPELGIEIPGTILISSHILPDIENLCTRIVIINSGKIVWDGTMDDINKEISNDNALETLVSEMINHE